MSEYAVTVDDAMERLAVVSEYDAGSGPEDCVHTFAASSFGLLGAHWSLAEVRAAFEQHGVERAGPNMQAMGHGLVVVEEQPRRRVIFFETKATT